MFYRYLPGDPLYFKRILDDVDVNTRNFQQKINDHRQTYDPDNPRDYIDIYLTQMDQQEKDHTTSTFSGKEWITLCVVLLHTSHSNTHKFFGNLFFYQLVYLTNFLDVSITILKSNDNSYFVRVRVKSDDYNS